MKNNFMIILDSLNLNSWNGTDLYDCNYYINLSSVLDYNYNFEKNYKITFSFKGSQSNVLTGNVIGVYLTNISYSVQSQENKKNTNLLGLLNTNKGNVITKEKDNLPFIIQGLNNNSVLSISIKKLILETVNTRTYSLTNLYNWYRFFLDEEIGLPNYDSNTANPVLYGGAQVLEDGILPLLTVPSYMIIPNLDFTSYATTPLTISVWIKTTQLTQFTLFVLNSASIFQFRIIPSTKCRCLFQYGGALSLDYSENNNTFNLADGNWNLITLVFGNIPTHKLYLNGILAKTGTNTITNLTGLKTNFIFGMNQASANNFIGEASDFRLYEKELTEQEISDYYYNNGLSKKTNYNIKLNFEELD